MASDSYKLNYDKVFGGRSSRKLVLGIIVLAVVIYGVWQGYGVNAEKASEKTSSEYKKKILEETLAESSDVCSRFSVVEGEVSCREAIGLTTGKYAGTVEEVAEGSGFRKKGETTGKDIWRIRVKLDTPVERNGRISDSIDVILDKKTGEELLISYGA